jgi:hypothetical protein
LGRYLDRIFGRISGRYLIGCYQMRGVAAGALGRIPPETPTWGGAGKQAGTRYLRGVKMVQNILIWFLKESLSCRRVDGSKPARQMCTYVDGGRQNF